MNQPLVTVLKPRQHRRAGALARSVDRVCALALASTLLITVSACGGGDDSSGNGDSAATLRSTLIPPAAPIIADQEPITQEVRGFDCTPSAVGDGETIATLPDGTGLWIEPAGDVPCHFDLYYDSGGARTKLSSTPGGYLFALGWVSPAGDLAICASNIHHEVAAGELHEITNVPLECAFRVQGNWTDLVAVVDPEGGWAAWPRSLAATDDDTNSITLDFVRDSTFNVLNMADAGRPPEDGVYTIRFTLESTGFVVSEPTHKTDDLTNPFESGPWEPTEEEKIALEGVIDFSDGECSEGCDGEPEGPTP